MYSILVTFLSTDFLLKFGVFNFVIFLLQSKRYCTTLELFCHRTLAVLISGVLTWRRWPLWAEPGTAVARCVCARRTSGLQQRSFSVRRLAPVRSVSLGTMNGKSTNGSLGGMACIEGLPPLPKSLSGLLNSSGGSWREMERMYVKKTMIQDDLSRGRNNTDSLLAHKPANLDAALALLRKEMVKIPTRVHFIGRQMELSGFFDCLFPPSELFNP